MLRIFSAVMSKGKSLRGRMTSLEMVVVVGVIHGIVDVARILMEDLETFNFTGQKLNYAATRTTQYIVPLLRGVAVKELKGEIIGQILCSLISSTQYGYNPSIYTLESC